MAWNPEPEVAAARGFGHQFRWPTVIIIGLDEAAGRYATTTYGQSRALCARADALGRFATDGLKKGIGAEPTQVETLRHAVERLRVENAALNTALFHAENGLAHPGEEIRKLVQAAHKAAGLAKVEG